MEANNDLSRSDGDGDGRRGNERFDRQSEHVGLAKRVLLVELDRAVDLDHPPACLVREQVDADEVSADRLGGADSELAGVGRRLRWAAMAAERDIRAPLASGRDPLDRSDDAAAGDHQPQVVAAGRDQLLDERPVPPEPGSALECVQARA